MHYIRAMKLNRLKVVLAEKDKSNKWLSDNVEVNPVTVSRWTNNVQQPSIEMLNRIAQVLNVNICDLLVQNEIKQAS